jgi:hypothetical protein
MIVNPLHVAPWRGAPFWFNVIVAVVLVPLVWPVFAERSVATCSSGHESFGTIPAFWRRSP